MMRRNVGTILTTMVLSMLVAITIQTSNHLIVAASNMPSKTDAITYQNSTYGISIKYPSNWGLQTGINKPRDTIIDVTDISPPIALDPNAVANFQIGAENLEPNNTKNLDLYLRNAINAYRFNATDFHIDLATTTNAQLAGKPAYVLLFSDTFNGFPMKTMVMGTFSDKHGDDKGKFYYVFYTAEAQRYDQLLPAVHQMIDSFKISRLTPIVETANITHATNTTDVGNSS